MSRLIAIRLIIAPTLLVPLVLSVQRCPAAGDADCATAVIDTFAGGGVGDGSKATNVSLSAWDGLDVAPDGNIYFADASHQRIRKIGRDGIITTVVGDGWHDFQRRGRFAGDGGPALAASLDRPRDVALAPDGSLYIADWKNYRIRKVSPDGIITTVAGDGYFEYLDQDAEHYHTVGRFAGDGGPATAASLSGPTAIAFGPGDALYIADWHRIRKVSADGIITTVAGNGKAARRGGEPVGDGGPALQAPLEPDALAVAPDGTLYVAELYHHRVRRIDPQGIITTVAGDGWHDEPGGGRFGGDGGPATNASLDFPHGLAVARDGTLYIADSGNHRIRAVDGRGVIATVVGDGWTSERGSGRYAGDGGPAINASLDHPTGIVLAADGTLYLIDKSNHRIRRVQGRDGRVDPRGTITTVAGSGESGYSGEGGPAASAEIRYPDDVAVAPDGALYLINRGFILKVDGRGVLTAVAREAVANARFDNPRAIAVGPDGSIFVATVGDHRVHKVDPRGIVTTVAGNGDWGEGGLGRFSGDGGPATDASLAGPVGVAVGPDGSLYIADCRNNRIRKVDTAGIITSLVGSGELGYAGDGGAAGEARLAQPEDVALGPDGSLYIADGLNHCIRQVLPRDGRLDPSCTIITVAGTGKAGYSGDGGPATEASLRRAEAVAVGPDGSLYISDNWNRRIRMVDREGIITTVAGSGEKGFMGEGDGGPATEARFFSPRGIAVGPDGTVYVADPAPGRVRRIRCGERAARQVAAHLRAKAGDSADAWRSLAKVYLMIHEWDDALVAAERLLALASEGDEPARMRAEVLVARAHAGKRDDHEARRRLLPVLARSDDPTVLRDAADVLVDLYLLRGERDQAIATLNDLRLRTGDRRLRQWIDQQVAGISGAER